MWNSESVSFLCVCLCCCCYFGLATTMFLAWAKWRTVFLSLITVSHVFLSVIKSRLHFQPISFSANHHSNCTLCHCCQAACRQAWDGLQDGSDHGYIPKSFTLQSQKVMKMDACTIPWIQFNFGLCVMVNVRVSATFSSKQSIAITFYHALSSNKKKKKEIKCLWNVLVSVWILGMQLWNGPICWLVRHRDKEDAH